MFMMLPYRVLATHVQNILALATDRLVLPTMQIKAWFQIRVDLHPDPNPISEIKLDADPDPI